MFSFPVKSNLLSKSLPFFNINYLVKNTIEIWNGGFDVTELGAVGTFIVSVFGGGVAGLLYNRAKDFAKSRNKE